MAGNDTSADDALPDDGLGAVRPYALVHGRVTPSRSLDRASLVKARTTAPSRPLQVQYALVFDLCRAGAISVAEITARLGRPLQIVKILLSDLLDDGYLINAMPDTVPGAATDPQLLGAVLAALHRI